MIKFGCTGRFTVKGRSCVGQQKVVEAKNGTTEQTESDNLQHLLALLTTASHITSHIDLSSSSSHMCKTASRSVNVSYACFIAFAKLTVVLV